MQIIHDFGINYLAYYRRGKNNAYPEIEQCAYCKDRLLKNGYYQRYMISFSKTYRIFIRRYRCRHCHRSLSVLPSFLLPRMQYLLTVIVIRLLRYLERKQILLDMRNLFFHLKRFKKNIGGVIMFLREHHALEPPFPKNYTKEKAKDIIKRRIQKKKGLTNGQIIGIIIPMTEGWGQVVNCQAEKQKERSHVCL